MDLENKVALVTGASRGVGAAVEVALAQAGADVACAARATAARPQKTPGTLDETVARVEAEGRRGLAIPTNLAVQEQVEAMVATATEHFGRVDILVNNAAITFVGDLELPLKMHDLVMEVNLRAPLIATRAVVPGMKARGEGAIVNVSSAAALNVFPGLMSYGMSKVALERFTLDAAQQLEPAGVAVNCFRIDIPVASEGFLANQPDMDHSNWEPTAVAAEGILWVLRQPAGFTGRLLGMRALRESQGIMKSQASRPFRASQTQRWDWAPPVAAG